jgi:hypothetical protein
MPELILQSVKTIICMEIACILNPESVFVIVIMTTRQFVTLIHPYL